MAVAETELRKPWLAVQVNVLKRQQGETAAELDALLPSILPPSLQSYGVASDKAFKGEF